MGPIRFTRSAVIVSAVVHGGALVLAVLFTGANPFNSEPPRQFRSTSFRPAKRRRRRTLGPCPRSNRSSRPSPRSTWRH